MDTYTGPEAFCEPDSDWHIYVWPDGTWCDKEDLHQFGFMSDDYELRRVISYDEAYCPIKTERA